MRRFWVILLVVFAMGCGGRVEVPDLTKPSGGPSPVFLIDQTGSMVAIDAEGKPVPDQSVRLDIVKIGDTVARAITSRSTAAFTWTGRIPPKARLTCLVGVGDAPVELFNVFSMIPPINAYGRKDVRPPSGIRFRLTADGQEVFVKELSREELTEWSTVTVDLSSHAGENVKLEFSGEGILVGTVLPYWGHPQIVAPRERPRRVILFGLDTVAAGHVSWLGYKRKTTAVLDSLANRSVVFTDGHSCSPWTLPSFAAVLSGRLPGVTGADRRNRGLSMHEDMLAEIFRRNGFATAGFVNIPHLQEAGFFQGVDHQWEVQDLPAPQALEQARNWIDYNSDQDFFVFIHLFDPHIAYVPPRKWADKFRAPDYSGLHADKWFLHGGIITRNHYDPAVWAGFGEVEQKQCENLYDAEIAGMDEAIGNFLAWYEEKGLLDDSLIIVFSDHGEEFGQHGRWEHGHSQYEEQIHVPFFIKLPGETGSRRVDGLVATYDTYPTLLELFGFKSETEPSGVSLVPILRGGSADTERRTIAESTLWGPETKTVVTNRYKYILTVPTGQAELYDLVSDPLETKDILKETPDVSDELGKFLETYVNKTQAGWHLRLLAGPQTPMSVGLRVRSEGAIENPELVTQILNGSGEGLVAEDTSSFRVNLNLKPGDIVEVRFSTDPENSSVTFEGSIGDASARDAILLGAYKMSLTNLAEKLASQGVEIEQPTGDDLTLTIEDPVIAFSFPDYAREDDRGAYLWSVPKSLRAHPPALTPEQEEALQSLGYVFE